MKKCSVRKLLSVMLTFSVLMTFMTPFTSLKNVFAADSEPFIYAPEAFSKQQLINDGWVSTVTDSSGKITKNSATVYDQGRRNDFWWKFSDGTVQGQGDKDCEDNFGKAYQSLTYTGRKLTDFNLKMSVKDGKYNCRTAFSIGLKNAGEMYLNDSSPENVITLITNPSKSSVWNDPTFTIKGAALVKGTQTCAVKQAEGIISWDITVDGNRLIIIANGDFTYEFELNDKYTGGYVSFSSANSYNIFNPPVIKELTEKQTDYFSYLTGLEGMAKDGWVASYSENPQRGTTFTECSKIDEYFKVQYGGIIRNEKGFNWSGNNSYGNWKDPFQKMSALTYTAKKYKYFTLTVDYRIMSPGIPWPVISFGQPSTTAEMFYHKANAIESPTGGDSAIGLWPELEGSLNIAGKNVTAARQASDKYSDKNEWHTLTLTVTPGQVNISVDDGAVTLKTGLSSKYAGGYIALMLGHSYSQFKNFGLTELKYEEDIYSNFLNDISLMTEEGWKAAYSEDPQRGVAFTDCESINQYFKNQDDGIIRNEVGFDWQGNHSYNNWKDPFQKTASVTYAERQYKYFTLNVDYKVSSPGVPWPVVTFGQPNTTPEMFYKVTSDVSNPTGGDSAIAVYPETEGTINIAGKKVTDARKESTAFTEKNEWHTLTVIVTPGIVTVSVDGDKVVISTELSSTYTGGYISLMLGHSYSRFKNFSIKELKFEDTATYTSSMANLDFMTEDGWISAYSENPQRGVPFKNCESLNSYFKNEMDGIIRNEVGFDWQGNHSYGNWKDPFQKMAALTYGAKQYKYFTLSIDYTVYTPGVPWPVISFGQPETTPEMFYHKANAIENPAGGDSAIGLWPELEGSLNITGANVEKKRVSSDKYTDMKQWHTLTLTVMPGEVTVSIDGGAVELTAELSSRYEGGYIALMLGHSYSRYKNISITDYTYLDAVQNSGEEEVAFDFAEGEGVKPVLLNIKPARWYEFDTINVVTADGSEAQINEIKSGFYMIGGATLSSITVKYKKKALDYDPLYAVRYYFDWEEELGDFTTLNSENALNTDFTAINAGDRWTVNNGLLKISGATVSDSNLLLIGNRKFRNFELTLEYKHGSNRGFMGGPVFGITDTSKYCTKAGGGIWTMIEADARAMARGLDVKNISDDGRWPSSFEYLIKPWIPNIENYPSQGDKIFNNYTHKLKLRVVEGKAEMWVDDTKDPLTMLIPRDYAGYVGIGVTNNSCSYDNLKIQPLNEFGKPITLEESDRLIENFSLENVEADPWDGDTSEWGDAPVDYFYD